MPMYSNRYSMPPLKRYKEIIDGYADRHREKRRAQYGDKVPEFVYNLPKSDIQQKFIDQFNDPNSWLSRARDYGARNNQQQTAQSPAWQNSPLGNAWKYGIKPAIGAIQRSYNQRNPGQAIQKGVNGFINQIPMAQRAATNAYIQQNWKQPDVPVTPDVPVDSVAHNPKPSLMSRVGKLLGL